MFKLATVLFCVLLVWTGSRFDYERIIPEPEVVVDVECHTCQIRIKSNTNWSSRYFTEETTSYFCSEECLSDFNQGEQEQQEN